MSSDKTGTRRDREWQYKMCMKGVDHKKEKGQHVETAFLWLHVICRFSFRFIHHSVIDDNINLYRAFRCMMNDDFSSIIVRGFIFCFVRTSNVLEKNFHRFNEG